MLWLLDTPAVTGLFNVGTGKARTYLDLAHAVCAADGVARDVAFIDMPEKLRGQYQSFTEARWRGCAPPASPASSRRLRTASALHAGLPGAATPIPYTMMIRP